MDEADISDERIEIAQQNAIRISQKLVEMMAKGNPGECDKCGETMPRLVNGWCCRCRDKFKMGYN